MMYHHEHFNQMKPVYAEWGTPDTCAKPRARTTTTTTSASVPKITREQRERMGDTSAINTEHHACVWGFALGMFCTCVYALASVALVVAIFASAIINVVVD